MPSIVETIQAFFLSLLPNDPETRTISGRLNTPIYKNDIKYKRRTLKDLILFKCYKSDNIDIFNINNYYIRNITTPIYNILLFIKHNNIYYKIHYNTHTYKYKIISHPFRKTKSQGGHKYENIRIKEKILTLKHTLIYMLYNNTDTNLYLDNYSRHGGGYFVIDHINQDTRDNTPANLQRIEHHRNIKNNH